MIRRTIPLPLEVADYDDQIGMTIYLDHETIGEWCVNLWLLDEKLIDKLVVESRQSPYSLTIGRLRGKTKIARGTVNWQPDGPHIDITDHEFGAWSHFFLRCYRDGLVPSHHIDVDVPPEQSDTEKGLFLTLIVPESLPPIDNQKARRRLGLV